MSLSSKHTHTHRNTLSSLDTDLQVLFDLRLKHLLNSLFGYLNINSLRNKVLHLRECVHLVFISCVHLVFISCVHLVFISCVHLVFISCVHLVYFEYFSISVTKLHHISFYTIQTS